MGKARRGGQSKKRDRRAKQQDQPGKSGLRRSVLWGIGLVSAAAATVITGALVSIPGQVFDSSEAQDALRPGEELSVAATIIHLDDEGRSMVAPTGYRPSEGLLQQISQPMAAVSDEFQQELRAT